LKSSNSCSAWQSALLVANAEDTRVVDNRLFIESSKPNEWLDLEHVVTRAGFGSARQLRRAWRHFHSFPPGEMREATVRGERLLAGFRRRYQERPGWAQISQYCLKLSR
jgi:AraC-like DNA-binding protein